MATIAIAELVLHAHPETSRFGIAITIAALFAMPILAWLKNREALRTNNPALRADAVQSATCAYLAGITFIGLLVNAISASHGSIRWTRFSRCLYCSKKGKQPGAARGVAVADRFKGSPCLAAL